MNLIPIYRMLDNDGAPPHSKDVIRCLLVKKTCGMTQETFDADREMQALERLGLLTFEAGKLVVTQEAYKLAGIDPPRTAVEIL